MLKNFLLGVTISTMLIFSNGCVTLKQSRIPEFIQELNSHEFSPEERQTIGEILNYINQLENQ